MQIKAKVVLLNLGMLVLTAAVAVPLGTYGAQYWNEWKDHSMPGNFKEHVDKLPYAITLYGTSTCIHCRHAREYLKKAGIAFNDLQIDKSDDADRRFQNLGLQGVPVLVSETAAVPGFYPKDFDRVIQGTLTR
jgi:glutaredoxin